MAMVVATFTLLAATPIGRPIFNRSTLYRDFILRQPRNFFPQPQVTAAHAIYAGPCMPGMYYELGKKNPYFISFTLVCNDDCRRRLLAQIQEIKPEIVFLEYKVARPFGYDLNNLLDSYLREHYLLCPAQVRSGDGMMRARRRYALVPVLGGPPGAQNSNATPAHSSGRKPISMTCCPVRRPIRP